MKTQEAGMWDTSIIPGPKKPEAEGARVQASSGTAWNQPTNQLIKKIQRARLDGSGLKSQQLGKPRHDSKFKACLGYKESSRPA